MNQIDTHTPIVTSQVAPEYGVTIGNSATTPDTYTNYTGVNKAITTAVDLKELVNGTNTTDATAVTPNIRTTANNTTYNSIFTLQQGVTKFRVYMWVEGQDIDCENNATGSDISYTIQLSTLDAPVAP